MQDEVFVLDIGTRSVMALLARYEGEELVISNLICQEHKTRSMLDGQIHYVEQVGQVINDLVQEMSVLCGRPLKEVAVAAAGRSLKTVKGVARVRHSYTTTFTKDEAIALELQAVQEAQLALPKGQSNTPISQQYYCVGYSIREQRLDGSNIGFLVGQKGQEAEVEVVATFLPRIVVDSLQSAVEYAGLELSSITLEPIAVANIVLNPTMRRLNLVLVDIGAGTSDIAVCGGNSILAYGMVPMAGDEITESLSDHYLLDFSVAEDVKRRLTIEEKIKATDVLGFEQELSCKEVQKALTPAVDTLAAAIAQEIHALNGKSPQALLLVGGGSLTPGLTYSLSNMLGIPTNRIAVQSAGKLANVSGLASEYSGPDYITVLGIGYTALTSQTLGFITVTINGKPVRLLNLMQNNMAEALVAGGYNIRDFYGRPGMALTCEINGQLHVIKGKPGRPGLLRLNGQQAEFGTLIQPGDDLVFIEGMAGENASVTFRDLLSNTLGSCTVNGETCELTPTVQVGDEYLTLDDPVRDGYIASVKVSRTILDILVQMGLCRENEVIWVNNKELPLLDFICINKNGIKANPREEIAAGDQITVEISGDLVVDNYIPKETAFAVEVTVNGEKVGLNDVEIQVNGKPAGRYTKIVPGDRVEYRFGADKYQPILIDIFKEINFSPVPPPGKTYPVILVNGEEKEYTYNLQNGDQIELSWI